MANTPGRHQRLRPHRPQLLPRLARRASANFDIVAANDLGDAQTMAHLLKFDSTLGPFAGRGRGRGRRPARRRPARSSCSSSATRRRCRGATSASTSCSSRPASSPTARARRSTSTRARGRSSSRRRRPTPTSRSRSASTTTRYDPETHHIISNASCTTNCLGAAREGAARRVRDRARLHDDDPRLHGRPAAAGHAALGPAPGPRGRDQPDPDLDRRREGDRARAARARRQARRRRGARPRADRLDHRPRRDPSAAR